MARKIYTDATIQQAHDNGYDRAHAMAANAEIDLPLEEDGMTLDEDAVMDILNECESLDRQFSPFEATASFLNSHDEEVADELWSAYEAGTHEGLVAGYNWTGLAGSSC